MSSRDPKSATGKNLEGRTLKYKNQVDSVESFRKPSLLPDELHRWIDLVIVPILVEQYLREKQAPGERTDG